VPREFDSEQSGVPCQFRHRTYEKNNSCSENRTAISGYREINYPRKSRQQYLHFKTNNDFLSRMTDRFLAQSPFRASIFEYVNN
jgi:hypothetical protein